MEQPIEFEIRAPALAARDRLALDARCLGSTTEDRLRETSPRGRHPAPFRRQDGCVAR